MKTPSPSRRPGTAGFTLVEVMISMTIAVLVLGMCMSTYIFCLRLMYKDTQRLATNASLRSFMAQISKETLNASYFYLFPYYTKMDGSVDLVNDPSALSFDNATDDDYDKWVGQGDCLILVTKTSLYRSSDIKQIRIYYRVTTDQASTNAEAPIRYYETPDTAGSGSGWGEGTAAASNGHLLTNLTAELNAINLNANPKLAGSKLLNARSKGRKVPPSPVTGLYPNGPYASGDLYPMFSSESPTNTPSNGFISLNIEFINGTTVTNMLSSSSFNYTISPRR